MFVSANFILIELLLATIAVASVFIVITGIVISEALKEKNKE